MVSTCFTNENGYASEDNDMELILKMKALSLSVEKTNEKEQLKEWKSSTNIPLIADLIRKHDPMMTGRKWGIALIDLVVDVRRNLGYSDNGIVFEYEGFYYLLPGDIVDNVFDAINHQDAEESENCWLMDMWSVLKDVLDQRA